MTTQEPEGHSSKESSQPQPNPAPPTAHAGETPALAPTKKPGGLALVALFVGIGAFLVGLVPVLGILVGIGAIVLGILALRKQQPKGLAIAGIVLGFVAALSSFSMTLGIGAILNSASDDGPVTGITQTETPEIVEAPSEPIAEAEEPEPEVASVPAEYKSALSKATSYSDNMHMSKAGLYNQLTSDYGEQFSPEAAQYGVDNVKADWNANALAKAKSYQEQMSMSPEGIRDQLTSEYGEQFTAEQADYAIQHLND